MMEKNTFRSINNIKSKIDQTARRKIHNIPSGIITFIRFCLVLWKSTAWISRFREEEEDDEEEDAFTEADEEVDNGITIVGVFFAEEGVVWELDCSDT